MSSSYNGEVLRSMESNHRMGIFGYHFEKVHFVFC